MRPRGAVCNTNWCLRTTFSVELAACGRVCALRKNVFAHEMHVSQLVSGLLPAVPGPTWLLLAPRSFSLFLALPGSFWLFLAPPGSGSAWLHLTPLCSS